MQADQRISQALAEAMFKACSSAAIMWSKPGGLCSISEVLGCTPLPIGAGPDIPEISLL
jgi:hypothetical protein